MLSYDPPKWPPTDDEQEAEVKRHIDALYDWCKSREMHPSHAIVTLSLVLSSLIALSNDQKGCTETVVGILRQWVGKYNASNKRH